VTFLDKPKSALKTEPAVKQEVRFMADDTLESDLLDMVQELNKEIEDGVDMEDLANHVIQAQSIHNVELPSDGEDIFHFLDSGSDSDFEIPDGQVNC
jgi:hypothetical protein